MNRCKDCRHWLVGHVQIRRLPDDRANRAFLLLPDDPVGAKAALAEPAKFEEFSRCLGNSTLVHGALDTKADFGCNQWEAKK